jgi:hypothetical protein
MPRIPLSRWLPLTGFGLLLVAIPSLLAASGALPIQVVAAAGGAFGAASGASLIRVGWPHRRRSEVQRLLAAFGFFLLSAGTVAMLAGVGLYH